MTSPMDVLPFALAFFSGAIVGFVILKRRLETASSTEPACNEIQLDGRTGKEPGSHPPAVPRHEAVTNGSKELEMQVGGRIWVCCFASNEMPGSILILT